MASYQDIEQRLRTVESKLDFIMKQFKVTKQELSATVDASGRPAVKTTTMDLLQVYHETRNGSVEIVNGTE